VTGSVGHILFATHGGASADGAARVAALLAERWHASLDVLTVFEAFPTDTTSPLEMGFGVGSGLRGEEVAGLRDVLQSAVATQLRRCHVGNATAPVVRTGPVAQQISDAARAAGAALIVIGLGPHGVIDRALGGETALQLVQVAGTPVLAVPEESQALPRHAMAAIDFTATSVTAARVAAQCLSAGDALDLVHVWPENPRSPALAGGPRTSPLRELASQLIVPSGVEVVAVELHGDTVRALLAYVESSGVDLIALGSHGYGWWKRLALGSVASKVLRMAPRAVLVAPIGSIGVPG
jgi:nucleotide-binding universal stress UspA family protein